MTDQTTSAVLAAPLVPLDELPRYSPWPARILGLSSWQKHERTEAELYREYEVEFFAAALQRARAHYADKVFRDWFSGETAQIAPKPCLTEHGIRLLAPRTQLDAFIDLVEETLAEKLPAAALCDLGAGTGKILHCLAERGRLHDTPLMAFEFSPSARELILHFSRNQGYAVQVQPCNFLRSPILEAPLPKNPVFMTSVTLCCLPVDMRQFLLALLALKPRFVAHFEPCGDLLQPDNLHHMLCRRYFESNNYSTSIHVELRRLESEGALRVRRVRPHVYGNNPLCPLSVVTWEPA